MLNEPITIGRYNRNKKPATAGDLQYWIRKELGLTIPIKPVCPYHQAPFEYVRKAFFEPTNDLIVWARKADRTIGRVTVYRTLKVMVDAGLVEERPFRRDRTVYEHVIGHRHHDHMVCLGCQEIIEFANPRIEAEQERSAEAHQFRIVNHHHTLFGYCLKCDRGGKASSGA